MADLERTYNIPLRKSVQRKPIYKRTKKAVNTVRDFLMKHMKADTVKLGPALNKELWKNGIRNPPHHVKVVAKKKDDVVTAELVGFEYIDKAKTQEEKAPVDDAAAKKEEQIAKLKAALGSKKPAPKKPVKKEAAKEEPKTAPETTAKKETAKPVEKKETKPTSS